MKELSNPGSLNPTPDAHLSFPLSSLALSSFSLTPDFFYQDPSNARLISARPCPSEGNFSAAEYAAIGLIGRVFLRVINLSLDDAPNHQLGKLDDFLIDSSQANKINLSLEQLVNHYPTNRSYYAPSESRSYQLSAPDPALRHSFFKTLILVMTAERNISIRKHDQIFTDNALIRSDLYRLLSGRIKAFFTDHSSVAVSGLSLLDFLDQPAKKHPGSLSLQLAYIRQNWDDLLGAELLEELLRALDYLQEENFPRFAGPGEYENPLTYSLEQFTAEQESVRFSLDKDWMPNLVLIAKNVFVWLDQLSKKYQQPIFRLDQIPDQELALLSSWGITGLWLIGLWERSPASQTIKQICGNSDAVPSAYSLYDYSIASVLGGENAYEDFARRASAHHIRLAADMVPNHLGIYSRWIVDHPDRFLSLANPPFPGYSFNGVNLSGDPAIGIYLEDHYYSQEDASVVFKRVDFSTGFETYIYHGNDGTAMPWNDTAQLNFLNPETREAVIQSVISVARRFPIIRFDAAMTLAKKHYQRLWFPEPGAGGAIPTRSEHGLSKKAFDLAFPREFWQEVVERVAEEVPGTLLLAEAFWMMEGYFVRTLGMHRVYNSAFMHMLRDEKNREFRNLITETLEFDSGILQRYVNFMNNPDEETAIAQFGSDGKYFGVCLLMATLPGLPMFGHGQIEGYTEKYGMEYRWAYYDEQPNQGLIDRHVKEIIPLLQKRYLFAGVENFCIYDGVSLSGDIDDNILAYSNFRGNERALVIFHNTWGEFKGRIFASAPLNQTSTALLDGLGIFAARSCFLIFTELISGLQYIRSLEELEDHGLEVSLGAYSYQVFLNFEVIQSDNALYHQLHKNLAGAGVTNITEEIAALKYGKLLDSSTNICLRIADRRLNAKTGKLPNRLKKSEELHCSQLLDSYLANLDQVISDESFPLEASEIRSEFDALLSLACLQPEVQLDAVLGLAAFFCVKSLPHNQQETLHKVLTRQIKLHEPGLAVSGRDYLLYKELYQDHSSSNINLNEAIAGWFRNPSLKEYLAIHYYQDIMWFKKEPFEQMLDIVQVIWFFRDTLNSDTPLKQSAARAAPYGALKIAYLDLALLSNFQVEHFLELLHES